MKRTYALTQAIVLAATLVIAPCIARAHGSADHAKSGSAAISTDEHAFGVEGNPKKASRTVAISMDDSMRYSQSEIRVKQGETLTFVIRNKGKLLHELVIGTESELQQHAELMRKNPDMEHDEPYMAHVKPGTTERMTWRFSKSGTFLYGCLVPGHFEAGMKGRIIVATNK
ncbi:MAG: cupredoxin family protein [Betaproteobacteria bacterium]